MPGKAPLLKTEYFDSTAAIVGSLKPSPPVLCIYTAFGDTPASPGGQQAFPMVQISADVSRMCFPMGEWTVYSRLTMAPRSEDLMSNIELENDAEFTMRC